ncbi:hypothetical protein CYMTET_26260 [Cymbomonas tetramitiformis]|uniref:Uncharacterized protein n=1 Tax=Cymbomonas tetramitiformis TaxID=36881 RepID=A0AAE0FSF4_9CHLO|nr:hypothetical protein CYMTET_26260 [Cymbomonas tetramitiformis]
MTVEIACSKDLAQILKGCCKFESESEYAWVSVALSGCTDVADWTDTDGVQGMPQAQPVARVAAAETGKEGSRTLVVDNFSDYPSWADTDGAHCRTYEDNEYCTRTGEFGPG